MACMNLCFIIAGEKQTHDLLDNFVESYVTACIDSQMKKSKSIR